MNRPIIQKSTRWVCKNYTDWVKSQPSCLTGMPADDPHHLIGIGQDIGRNVKPHDIWTVPLTRGEHKSFHRHGSLGWGLQLVCDPVDLWQLWYAKQTIDRAISEGVIRFCSVAKQ